MDDIPIIGLLITSAVLITLSMLFSISESAFLGINQLRLRILLKKKDKCAIRVAKLLKHKEKLINTLLVANDLVNILLSSIITSIALKLFGANGVGIATILATVLLLIFGEITPKTLATRNPDGIAYSLSLFVKIVMVILRPIVYLFTVTSRIYLKIRKINTKPPKQSYTEEDIKSFIDASSESGILENGEKNMMNRVFKFTDLEAQDIMVPRTSVIALNEKVTYNEILEIAQRTRISHFPVYKNNIDDITGVLYLKDLLKVPVDKNGKAENFDVRKIMRKPLFVPGTNKMSSVQELLRENHQSFAIVIDEYSGTDGILTKEDICREIFGTTEISKPWRNNPQSAEISEFSKQNEFSLDGATLLIDLKEILGITFVSEMSETLGGWITEKLGRLANPYDSVQFEGYLFTVETVYMRRIKLIKIKKITNEQVEQ